MEVEIILLPFDDSFQKKRFLVIFRDYYTKFRYGYIVKQKSVVKDNGGEFDNSEVREILQKAGITLRLTAPFTPQQNGRSERENRTIVEMAKIFMYSNPEIKFPEEIWSESVNTAVHVLNGTGKSSEKEFNPYELWLGKKPRIKHRRIVGAACFVHVPFQKRRKIDEKAEKGYLVSYDGDERYRVYLPEQNKIVISRDVKFQEKFSICEQNIKLPFQGTENGKKEGEASSSNDSVDEDTNKEESEVEDTIKVDSDRDYEIGAETNCDKKKQTHRTQSIYLRDRSTPKKPAHLEDYITAAESFVTDCSESFQEAIRSSIKWKKAM